MRCRQFTFDVRQQTIIARFWRVRNETLDSPADHGILAHQDDRLAAERLTDFVHLLRADIVDGDNEDRLVAIEQGLELLEVHRLGR